MLQTLHKMQVVEYTRRAELLLLLVLALAPATAPAQTPEPTVIRLRDAIGDTIDRAERDSFDLFPNTADFQYAAVLALPGPEFFARVTLASADSTRNIFFRIMPNDLERIRFLIDNHGSVAEQQRTDSTYAQALASFWNTLEGSPLRRMPREPFIVQTVPQAPTRTATVGEQEPATSQHRYDYTLLGTGLGSLAGGYVGSRVGIDYVRSQTKSAVDACGYSYTYTVNVYSVNYPVFWGAACGMTAAGSIVGYMIGDGYDRKALPSQMPADEGKSWRTCCAIGSVVPGILLGTGFLLVTGIKRYGKLEGDYTEIDNDPDGLTILPMALTGFCITVELATIGYRIGRAIDRRNAGKAEAKRRAPGH